MKIFISWLLFIVLFTVVKSDQKVVEFLKQYDDKIGHLNNVATIAEWNYNTNLTDENAAVHKKASKEVSDYNAEAFKVVEEFDLSELVDYPELLRQIKKVQFVGN